MYKLKIFLLALVIGTNAHADFLQYKIAEYRGFSSKISSLRIYRHNNAVLYVYPQSQLAVLWSVDARGKLIKSVYSDADKFGIDYNAADVRREAGDISLAQKMLSFAPAQDMQFSDNKIPAAFADKPFTLNNLQHFYDAKGTNLYWQPTLKLVYNLQTGDDKRRQIWQLETYRHTSELAAREIAKRAQYNSIDFADVGDNESLPELKAMLRRGILKHASGFYRANGTPILRAHVH